MEPIPSRPRCSQKIPLAYGVLSVGAALSRGLLLRSFDGSTAAAVPFTPPV